MANHDEQATEKLLEKSKSLFDGSVQELDAASRTRLRAARQRALAQLDSPPWFAAPKVWAPAASAIILAVLIVPGLERGVSSPDGDFGTVAAADLELLLGEEELEMLAELEFYEWLDAEDVIEPGGEIEDGVG
jgi:hypothetical protein